MELQEWTLRISLFYRYTHELNISKGNNRYRNGNVRNESG